MRNKADRKQLKDYFDVVKTLPEEHPCYLLKDIARERKFIVACNYAYEVVGSSPVSDSIYEYVISRLELFKEFCPDEWKACDVFYDYFVKNDDWTYTGSGVPQTEEAKKLSDYLFKKWEK